MPTLHLKYVRKKCAMEKTIIGLNGTSAHLLPEHQALELFFVR
jgi:hypothetical protein